MYSMLVLLPSSLLNHHYQEYKGQELKLLSQRGLTPAISRGGLGGGLGTGKMLNWTFGDHTALMTNSAGQSVIQWPGLLCGHADNIQYPVAWCGHSVTSNHDWAPHGQHGARDSTWRSIHCSLNLLKSVGIAPVKFRPHDKYVLQVNSPQTLCKDRSPSVLPVLVTVSASTLSRGKHGNRLFLSVLQFFLLLSSVSSSLPPHSPSHLPTLTQFLCLCVWTFIISMTFTYHQR